MFAPSRGNTDRHRHHKIARPLLEATQPAQSKGGQISDQGLDDEDDGDHSQIDEFPRRQLRCQLGEDWTHDVRTKTEAGPASSPTIRLTKTWSEEGDVEVGQKLLRVGIEHALTGHDVARETDADYLQDGLEDQQD